MTRIAQFLEELPLAFAALIALTWGLAPFSPPHVWEKLTMLAAGTLSRPIDIFDLVLHGSAWLLFAAKLGRMALHRPEA